MSMIWNENGVVVTNSFAIKDLSSNGSILTTSTGGKVMTISRIDTNNLSETLQNRLNDIETQVNNTDLSINSLTIAGLSTGFLKSDEQGEITSTGIVVSDVANLTERLSGFDVSINALSSNTGSSSSVGIADVSGLNVRLSGIDSSLNFVIDTNVIQDALQTVNVSNFAQTWTQLANSPTDNGVGCANSANGQYILKLGWGAPCYLSTDYGVTWNTVPSLGSYQWIASISVNGNYILVSSITGNSMLSKDYGATWNNVSGVYGTPSDAKVSQSGRHQVITTSNGIYYSSNFGQSFTNWTDSGTNSWTSVAMSDDGRQAVAVRATTTPKVWKTTNYGASWSEIYSNPSNVAFGSIAMSGNGRYILIALTQNTSGNMYLSTDYGATFSALTFATSTFFRVAINANGMYMVAACNSGNIYFSKNNGATWSTSPASSTNYYGIGISANANLIYAYAPGQKMFCFNANLFPAFSAYASGQQSNIGNNVITFNQIEFDTTGGYNTSNSRWTPSVAGYYQINSLVSATGTTGGDAYVMLRKNGNTLLKASSRYSTSLSFLPMAINTVVYLSASDYVEIFASTTATTNTPAVFGQGTNQYWVYFNGCLLRTA